MKPLLPDREESGLEPCCADEQWAPVPGFEDEYEVSSCGRVWSIPRLIVDATGASKRCGGKLKKCFLNKGIWYVTLCRGRHSYVEALARIVLTVFSGEHYTDRYAAMLIDEAGPHASNLEWRTRTDALLLGVERGTKRSGENHFKAQLSCSQVELIKQLLSEGRLTHREIGALFGVKDSTIENISLGRAWKCGPRANPGQSVTPCP